MSGQQAPSAPTGVLPFASEALAGKYLTFRLSGQSHGIAILGVREIIAFQDITPLPGARAYIDGVINLRGRIIPVIDLRLWLSFEAGERSERTCIIVTEIESDGEERIQVGCIVDTVSEVLDITAEQIKEAPKLGSSPNLESILGLAKPEQDGEVVSLLDIHRVVDSLGEPSPS